MSIPRAKIKPERSMHGGYLAWDCTGCPDSHWVGYWTWMEAAEKAVSHVHNAHGVRTVGSLTADDIGKWIEVEDNAPFRITKLWHGQRTLIGSDGLGATFTGPSSVVCRVTEERP